MRDPLIGPARDELRSAMKRRAPIFAIFATSVRATSSEPPVSLIPQWGANL